MPKNTIAMPSAIMLLSYRNRNMVGSGTPPVIKEPKNGGRSMAQKHAKPARRAIFLDKVLDNVDPPQSMSSLFTEVLV